MKKLVIFAICAFFGALDLAAQSGMSSEALRFRNAMEQFLKEEGFTVTIDNDDNSLNWKKEGNRYWITVEDAEAPFYLELHRAGFSTSDVNTRVLGEACNHAAANKRCGKAYYGSTSCSFTAEYYCVDINQFRKTFYKYMRVVDSTREATVDYYNEHK